MPEAKKTVTLCLAFLATLAAASRASALAIIDSATYGGHTYYLLGTSTRQDAEGAAVGLGGHLVTIDDAAENLFVSTRFAVRRDVWIGLTDRDLEGTFLTNDLVPLSGVVEVAPVPEPMSLTLLGLGAAALAARRRHPR